MNSWKRRSLLLGIGLGCAGVCGIASASDGDLDLSFGKSSGIPGTFSAIHGVIGSKDDVAAAVALQPDGKIVAVGRETDSSANMSVFATRLDRQGNLDTSFAIQGFGVYAQNPLGGLQLNSENGRAVAVQSDGKIVIAGAAVDTAAARTRGLLLRLTASGSIDTTFRTGGVVAGLLDTVYNAIAIDPRDDSIIVAGWGTQDGNGHDGKVDRDFYVAHYDKDGGKFGQAFIAFDHGGNQADMAWGLNLSGDRVVLVGQSEEASYPSTHEHSACATASVLLPDLGTDAGWGENGKLTVYFDSYVTNPSHESRDVCRAVLTRRDGSVVVGGESFWSIGSANDSSDYSIVILNHNAIVNIFSAPFVAPLGDQGLNNGVYALAAQTDGRIVFAGKAGIHDAAQFPSNFGFGRLDPDGNLDPTFGVGGIVTPAYDFSLAANAGTVQYATGVVVDGSSGPIAAGVNYFWDAKNSRPYTTASVLFMKLTKDSIFANRFDP